MNELKWELENIKALFILLKFEEDIYIYFEENGIEKYYFKKELELEDLSELKKENLEDILKQIKKGILIYEFLYGSQIEDFQSIFDFLLKIEYLY